MNEKKSYKKMKKNVISSDSTFHIHSGEKKSLNKHKHIIKRIR